MTARELRLLAKSKYDEAQKIAKVAEERELTTEEKEKADALVAEVEGLLRRASAMERCDALGAHLGGSEGRTSDPLPHEVETRTPYRLLRAIDLAASGRPLDGLEGEVSAEIAKRVGKAPQGFYAPMSLPIDPRRGNRIDARPNGEYRVGTLDTTAGTGAVMTMWDATWIEYLRARVVCARAGAQVLSDLQGKFAIPRQSAAATFGWVTEGSSPSASNATLDQVLFSPHTLTGQTDLTRSLIKQTSFDAEAFARMDLMNGLAVALDKAGISGSGSGAEPLGLVNNSGLLTYALGTNGDVPTWAMVVGLETNVATGNADMGSLAYVTSPKGRGKLKQTARIGTTFPSFIWDTTPGGGGVGEMNGYPAYATNQCPSNLNKGTTTDSSLSAVVFGNFAEMIFALWGGVDLLVNPYSLSGSGSIRLNIFQDADIQVRHNASFSRCVDMVTT